MKIAVVGGGSTYTPELVSGLTRLDVDELVLEDVDPDRREVVGGMARRMLARQGFEGRLEVTGDLDTAVEGADYVLHKPSQDDKAAIDEALGRALEVLPLCLAGDLQGATQKLHSSEPKPKKAGMRAVSFFGPSNSDTPNSTPPRMPSRTPKRIARLDMNSSGRTALTLSL